MSTDVKEFTIVRSKWARGWDTGGGSTLLYNPTTERMCCLGFYGVACGAVATSEAESVGIWNQGAPHGSQSFWPRWLFEPTYEVKDGTLSISRELTEYYRLTEANDSLDISEEERERRVVEGFARHGIKVNFVD